MLPAQTALKTIQTATLEIAYEEDAPSNADIPVILLHGFPYSTRQYDALRLLLRDKFRDLRILVPYLRGFGATRYLDPLVPRSGQQAAVGQDLLDFLDALSIPRAILVGYDWGGRAACIVSALYPSRVIGLITCQGYSIQDIALATSVPPSPNKACALWYQFYFHTAIGIKGLEDMQLRKDLGKLLWAQWSPNWHFSDEEYRETAKAFENEDFVSTVIHSYRHRYANAVGAAALDAVEAELARKPVISVPTVIVTGGSDGVEPPSINDDNRAQFSGYYERHVLPNVGHCPPAEVPEMVLSAIETILGLVK